MTRTRVRVLLTGAVGALTGLASAVEALGAQLTEWPLLSFAPPADPGPLAAALGDIARFEAIGITSPRAADAVAAEARRGGVDLARAPVVWTSPRGAATLRRVFPRVQVPPQEGRQRSLGAFLAQAMVERNVGSPVLFPCGDLHRDELVTGLRDAGRTVHVVQAYRTVVAPASRASTVMGAADILVVTSPSVARLLASVEHRGRPAMVAIGPTTAGEAREHGWPPDAVAAFPIVSAVAAAINSLLPSYS